MLTINIYYTSANGNARKFAKEMIESGLAKKVRQEKGNLRYEYFYPADDPETVLLIDSWKDEQSLDLHHKSEMMTEISRLREKYKLKMKVERYSSL